MLIIKHFKFCIMLLLFYDVIEIAFFSPKSVSKPPDLSRKPCILWCWRRHQVTPGLFLFNKRERRLLCSDEILLPVHARHHKAKIARWQGFVRVESQRSRFKRAVVVKLRFRFTKRSALVERNKRKPSKDAHWHLRYRLQGDVRCESFSRYVCNMADTRQSVHV